MFLEFRIARTGRHGNDEAWTARIDQDGFNTISLMAPMPQCAPDMSAAGH